MKLILLDRDGVINEDSDDYIKSPDEWQPIPGSLEAIARLNQADYRVIVVSNQSGVARGLFTCEVLNQIHEKMHRMLAEVGGTIDAVFFCPHKPEDNCNCRKPKTGLYEDVARRLNITLEGVPAVGDSLRDIQAAQAVGASPWLVRTGKGIRTVQAANNELAGVPVFADLAAVVDELITNAEQQ
jgi:D-glycero-D-manno-heptose 1,7-bisphosphate phosphatase